MGDYEYNEYEAAYADAYEDSIMEDVSMEVSGADSTLKDIEAKYYSSKNCRSSDTESALAGFYEVVKIAKPLESSSSQSWVYRSYKQILKIHLKQRNFAAFMEYYRLIFEFFQGDIISRQNIESFIIKLLNSALRLDEVNGLLDVFVFTIKELESRGSFSVSIKVKLMLCKLYASSSKDDLLAQLLENILDGFRISKREIRSDLSTLESNQLLEVYSYYISLSIKQGRPRRVREFYNKSLMLKAVAPHPEILATICECGGKLSLLLKHWKSAFLDFQSSFRYYREAGNTLKASSSLRYMLLSNILSNENSNPFQDDSVAVQRKETEVQYLERLTSLYYSNEILPFLSILEEWNSMVQDPVVSPLVAELRMRMHTRALQGLLRPGSVYSTEFVVRHLNLGEDSAIPEGPSITAWRIMRRLVEEDATGATGLLDYTNRSLVVPLTNSLSNSSSSKCAAPTIAARLGGCGNTLSVNATDALSFMRHLDSSSYSVSAVDVMNVNNMKHSLSCTGLTNGPLQLQEHALAVAAARATAASSVIVPSKEATASSALSLLKKGWVPDSFSSALDRAAATQNQATPLVVVLGKTLDIANNVRTSIPNH